MKCTIRSATAANNENHILLRAKQSPSRMQVSPAYMGLRVHRYGPSTINSGLGVHGLGSWPVLLNGAIAENIKTKPATTITTPRILIHASPGNGMGAIAYWSS